MTTFAFQKTACVCVYMYSPYLTSRWTSWPRRAGPAQWSRPCARAHRHRASGCRLCVSVCPTHTQTWCVLLAWECHKEWGPPWRQRSTRRSGEEKVEMRVGQWDKYFTSRQFVGLQTRGHSDQIRRRNKSFGDMQQLCYGVLINITEPTEWRQAV